MKYTPPHQIKELSVAVWVSLAVSGVLYVFARTGIPYSSVLDLLVTLCLCAAAYILIRYRFTSVTYEIRPKTDRSSFGDDITVLPADMVDLGVHRAQGKRENLEFLMSLDKLTEVLPLEKDTAEKLRARYTGIKFYYYTVDIVRRERTALIFDDGGDKYCIILEKDGHITPFLENICRKNAENNERTGNKQ
jgi:hypothetical protein